MNPFLEISNIKYKSIAARTKKGKTEVKPLFFISNKFIKTFKNEFPKKVFLKRSISLPFLVPKHNIGPSFKLFSSSIFLNNSVSLTETLQKLNLSSIQTRKLFNNGTRDVDNLKVWKDELSGVIFIDKERIE